MSKNYRLAVQQDLDPLNPREFGDLCIMVCFHNRYTLGDKHNYKQGDYRSWKELKQAIESSERVAMIEPLYLFDHSGITISTSPFSCRWDSGQIGYVYMTQETKEKNTLSDEGMRDQLTHEIEAYNRFLSGEVYSYHIEQFDNESLEWILVSNCGGYWSEDSARLAGDAELKTLRGEK